MTRGKHVPRVFFFFLLEVRDYGKEDERRGVSEAVDEGTTREPHGRGASGIRCREVGTFQKPVLVNGEARFDVMDRKGRKMTLQYKKGRIGTTGDDGIVNRFEYQR